MKKVVSVLLILSLATSLQGDVVRSTAITPGAPALAGTNTFSGSNTFSGTNLFSGRNTFGTAADALDSVDLGLVANCVVFEGGTADANETRLCSTDATVGDGTINLPNVGAAATRTLAVLEAAQTFTATQTHTDVVVSKAVQGFSVQTLADNVAEDFVEISCPAGDGSGGTISYVAYAENGTTEAQQETGTIQWNCLNLAGTEVCPTPTEVGTPLHNETTGGTADLTTTWNCTVGLASVIRIGVAVNNGLATPTLVEIRYRVNVHSASNATVTALQ